MEIVLLVEDEWPLRFAHEQSLTAAGFHVQSAESGACALAVADTLKISAAIIDIGLRDRSSDDVVRGLRARYPTLPIMICTGGSAAELAGVAEDLNVRIVDNPVDATNLVSVLREHMQDAERA